MSFAEIEEEKTKKKKVEKKKEALTKGHGRQKAKLSGTSREE